MYGFAASAAFSATTTQAEALLKYQQFWAKPNAAALLALRDAGLLAYYLPDDHEWADDNWDHTDASLGASFTTQALVNQHWKRANDALEEFLAETWDNPPYDRVGNTERPSGSLQEGEDPPTTDYPIKYFYQDFDSAGNPCGTRALARIIFLDCISYRSPVEAADDASKVMLGAQQLAWLEATLVTARLARIPYVCIMSGKKLFRGSSDNADTFGAYTTERDAMFVLIDGTGVKPLWLSGDRHTLHVMEQRKVTGALCDILDVCACPIGVNVNGISPDLTGLIWQSGKLGYGLLTFGERLRVEIRSAENSSLLYSAEFNPFSNEPLYLDETVAYQLR